MVGVFIRGDADGRLHRAQADIWSVLAEVVEQAWALWEMLVLAKPLLVLAPLARCAARPACPHC